MFELNKVTTSLTICMETVQAKMDAKQITFNMIMNCSIWNIHIAYVWPNTPQWNQTKSIKNTLSISLNYDNLICDLGSHKQLFTSFYCVHFLVIRLKKTHLSFPYDCPENVKRNNKKLKHFFMRGKIIDFFFTNIFLSFLKFAKMILDAMNKK